ncbi:hypothetical protein NECAME_17420 [Necator americanus]|uniref:Uncharacterized protein n=1 Tax=Necator americanus TaxID=51031 RepID=W2TP87_NECAM|nr:hypothetical protein NECAME_17420 [Necator americanus]ETN83593.1 hypothetical protein NECAME_17420 [Necator americanus]
MTIRNNKHTSDSGGVPDSGTGAGAAAAAATAAPPPSAARPRAIHVVCWFTVCCDAHISTAKLGSGSSALPVFVPFG